MSLSFTWRFRAFKREPRQTNGFRIDHRNRTDVDIVEETRNTTTWLIRISDAAVGARRLFVQSDCRQIKLKAVWLS